MLKFLQKNMLIVGIILFFQNNLFAQMYRGSILGDIPAILDIKNVKGEERAFIKIVGKKQGWSGLEVERDKFGMTIKRDKPAENINFPIYLRDISQMYDSKPRSIYAGIVLVKGKDGAEDSYRDVLFVIDGLK